MGRYIVVARGGVVADTFNADGGNAAYERQRERGAHGELYVKVGPESPEQPDLEGILASVRDLSVFQVTVEQLTTGCRVKVDADNGYAEVFAPNTRTGLDMAVPYMHAVSCPDPLAALFGLPPAAGSPPDMGGGFNADG